MAKFKIRYVKFIFTPQLNKGNDWAFPPEPKIGFGNRHTEEWNKYQFHSNYIGTLFSDYLRNDPRRFKKNAKFTESEASFLLLKYLEDDLKEARERKKELHKILGDLDDPKIATSVASMWEYSLTVNKRELEYNTKACKIWRKKVREIKKSPQYLWEQLLK